MRKAFKQFAFSMAQVAPPDDDDFVEESDNEPSDNTMWSELDILAFFMNGDDQSGLNRSQSFWRATIQILTSRFTSRQPS